MPMTHVMSRPPGPPVARAGAGGYCTARPISHAAPPEGAAMMTDNIFLKIIEKKIPAKIVYEDDRCVAFHDVNPQAPVHVLLIPRKVIPTHADVKAEDEGLLGHLHVVAAQLAEKLGIGDGYRLVLNCKERAGQ